MKIRRRKSIRLQGYDYSSPGLYFITKCSKNRECFFGEVIRGNFLPTKGGVQIIKCWFDIPNHYPNIVLHAFVLMPDHLHGIIEITQPDLDAKEGAQDTEPIRINQFQRIIPGSLGSIMRGFEIGVTKWFRANTSIHEVWQRNFYDTIITSQKSYNRISKYIRDNPKNWTKDKFYNPDNP
jgi:REP element-mobilizing transposase RayT